MYHHKGTQYIKQSTKTRSLRQLQTDKWRVSCESDYTTVL